MSAFFYDTDFGRVKLRKSTVAFLRDVDADWHRLVDEPLPRRTTAKQRYAHRRVNQLFAALRVAAELEFLRGGELKKF